MKKQAIIIAAALMCFSMAGCGTTEDSKSAASDNAAAVTTEANEGTSGADENAQEDTSADAAETTEAEDKTEAETDAPEETDASEADIPEKDAAPTVAEAKELMTALDTIDRIGGGALKYDESNPYTADNGAQYYKADDSRFTATYDVRDYMNTYMTEDMISARYSGILGGDTPMCIDFEGALYVKYEPKGCGFAFTDTDPEIVDSFADGYSIMAEYDDYGAPNTLEIVVVKEDGAWKIFQLNFNS